MNATLQPFSSLLKLKGSFLYPKIAPPRNNTATFDGYVILLRAEEGRYQAVWQTTLEELGTTRQRSGEDRTSDVEYWTHLTVPYCGQLPVLSIVGPEMIPSRPGTQQLTHA